MSCCSATDNTHSELLTCYDSRSLKNIANQPHSECMI